MGIDPQNKKLLEIGGGRGYLQQAAREAGCRTVGLEISPYAIRGCLEKGLDIFPVPLEEIADSPLHPERYDLVGMYDFLEHVTDPGRILRITRTIIDDEGYLMIRTPNTDERSGPRLHLIDHLWHFSAKTLEALLQKEGFQVIKNMETGIFPSGTEGQDRIVNMTVFAQKK